MGDIQGGAFAALLLESGTSVIEKGRIFDSEGKGIYAFTGSWGELKDLKDTPIWLQATTVNGSVTWFKPGIGSSYKIEGTITIVGSLTIHSGVQIEFTNYSSSLSITGNIVAQGTASDSIYFIGLPNPSHNANSTHGGKITIQNSSSNSLLNYVTIERMGDVQGAEGIALKIANTSINIKNSTIINSEGIGLNIAGGADVTAEQCLIKNNQNGVFCTGGNAKFTNAEIYDNNNFGIQNVGAGIVDARSCWWGDDTGPYHPTSNPTGQANDVGNRIWFNPWKLRATKKLSIDVNNLDTLAQDVPAYYILTIPDSLSGVSIKIKLLSNATNGINELYANEAQIPLRGQARFNPTTNFGLQPELYLLNLSPGAIYVAIYPEETDTQHIIILVEALDFSIISVNPDRGGNTGTVTLKLIGVKFEEGMAIRLEDEGNVVAMASILHAKRFCANV